MILSNSSTRLGGTLFAIHFVARGAPCEFISSSKATADKSTNPGDFAMRTALLYILAWLMGVPLVVLIILYLLGVGR
jgi:hypothetical protein